MAACGGVLESYTYHVCRMLSRSDSNDELRGFIPKRMMLVCGKGIESVALVAYSMLLLATRFAILAKQGKCISLKNVVFTIPNGFGGRCKSPKGRIRCSGLPQSRSGNALDQEQCIRLDLATPYLSGASVPTL